MKRKLPPDPKLGDSTPWKKRFALFPKTIFCEKTNSWYFIWLEHYYAKRVYTEKLRATKVGPMLRCAWDPFYKTEP